MEKILKYFWTVLQFLTINNWIYFIVFNSYTNEEFDQFLGHPEEQRPFLVIKPRGLYNYFKLCGDIYGDKLLPWSRHGLHINGKSLLQELWVETFWNNFFEYTECSIHFHHFNTLYFSEIYIPLIFYVHIRISTSGVLATFMWKSFPCLTQNKQQRCSLL